MYVCCHCQRLAIYGTFCANCYHPQCYGCLAINSDIAELVQGEFWEYSVPVLPAPALSREIKIDAGMHICPGCMSVAIHGDLCAKCRHDSKEVAKWKLRDVLRRLTEEADHIESLKASLRAHLAEFAKQHDPFTPARPILTYEDWLARQQMATEPNDMRGHSQASSIDPFAATNVSDPFYTPQTETDDTRRQSSDETTRTQSTTEPTTTTETDGTRWQSDDDWEVIQSGIEETRGRFQTAVAALADNDAYWTTATGDLISP